MALDDTFDVFGATVADFDGVAVKDFIEFIVFREMFVVLVVRRVEFSDFSLTIFRVVAVFDCWIVRKFGFVITAF